MDGTAKFGQGPYGPVEQRKVEVQGVEVMESFGGSPLVVKLPCFQKIISFFALSCHVT